jgi:hypothetical protein
VVLTNYDPGATTVSTPHVSVALALARIMEISATIFDTNGAQYQFPFLNLSKLSLI